MRQRGTPVEAKQQLKGEVTNVKLPEVDATTGFPKELLKTGKVAQDAIDPTTGPDSVSVEDKVPTATGG